jgi:Protein of unknown function (DUF3489)
VLALWNGLSGADRLSKVGNREALLDRLWSALEALPDPQPARASKQAEVIALLRRPEGVTVDEVRAVTGWQPHTVRGVFSGALKKKLGLAISAACDSVVVARHDGGTRCGPKSLARSIDATGCAMQAIQPMPSGP